MKKIIQRVLSRIVLGIVLMMTVLEAVLIFTRPIVADAKETAGYKIRFINARNSSQDLNYILYLPEGVSENTPIFLFLHGDADVGETYRQAIKRYRFLEHLKSGKWQPDFIFVMPIGRKTGNWAKEDGNVKKILEEVTSIYGGNIDNIYVGGASAGADGITSIARSVEFKGAIYMAGHLNGKKGKLSARKVMELWNGKSVYYYRDNLQKKGGYGYKPEYIEECYELSEEYNVNFSMTDLDWNHDVGLVDATFLPKEFIDDNGNRCHDGINKLIYEFNEE